MKVHRRSQWSSYTWAPDPNRLDDITGPAGVWMRRLVGSVGSVGSGAPSDSVSGIWNPTVGIWDAKVGIWKSYSGHFRFSGIFGTERLMVMKSGCTCLVVRADDRRPRATRDICNTLATSLPSRTPSLCCSGQQGPTPQHNCRSIFIVKWLAFLT
jgi:hypothetical protein